MNTIKYFFILLLLIAPVKQALAQQTSHQHKEHVTELLTHYLALKEALTEDDFKTAQAHLASFAKEVTNSKWMNNHPVHAGEHASHHARMVDAVEQGSRAGNIQELRASFKKITEHLAMALENQGYDKQTLYIQYCPMAAGGDGASWISDKKKIVNPYMGQKMPGCGVTKETIAPDAR